MGYGLRVMSYEYSSNFSLNSQLTIDDSRLTFHPLPDLRQVMVIVLADKKKMIDQSHGGF